MNNLYPLKFKSIEKEKIWGGNSMRTRLKKDFDPEKKIGESWEISGLGDSISVVSNGFLKGNNLLELVEVYMGDLIGDHVFEAFGMDFPLLVKFIDAHDKLSIQVHPDNELAARRHGAAGKTEMWYIIDARPGSVVYDGFLQEMNPQTFQELVQQGKLQDTVRAIPVNAGDVLEIPPGRVHSIGPGILLAEVQQSSDITYRIYDWDRLDREGKARELHTELALDAIDFSNPPAGKIHPPETSSPLKLTENSHFHVSRLQLTERHLRDFHRLDSFLVYLCIEGSGKIISQETEVPFTTGETLLIPASLEQIAIEPLPSASLLEVYIP